MANVIDVANTQAIDTGLADTATEPNMVARLPLSFTASLRFHNRVGYLPAAQSRYAGRYRRLEANHRCHRT